MTIVEPTTMLTDYALAGVTGMLAWRLFRARDNQASRRYWAMALTAIALAAGLGGSYHGFALMLPASALPPLWKVTVLIIGIANFGMLAGSAIATTETRICNLLFAYAAAQLALFSGWMLAHDDFIYVVTESGVTMAMVAALHGWSILRNGDRASRYMLLAVGVSVIAAAVQASGFAMHRHFNHNDLYHVIQIGAMVLFHVGARRLRDHSEHGAMHPPIIGDEGSDETPTAAARPFSGSR